MKQQWAIRALLSRALARAYSTTPTSTTSTTVASDAMAAFPLKHVTRTNFEAAISELRKHIKEADFVAIDLEMTGVTSAPWRESFEFDRFDIRYLKVKDSAEKFAVVQFGVCPFRWDPLRLSFISHPHNFFLFPRQELPGEGNLPYEFLCQTTSIDFLAKYQFDFNACIREGVSYLSREQEEQMLKCLKSRCDDELSDLFDGMKDGKDGVLSTVTDTLFSERMKRRLIEWRDGLMKTRDMDSQLEEAQSDSKHQFRTVFYMLRPAVCLTGFTSHQLKLICLVTKKHFRDLVYVGVNGQNSSEQLVVYTDSERDKELLLRELKDEYHREAEMKINNATGFRHVIDLLSSEKKLIVGHNCFLDIAHIYNKFIGRLSPSVEEFVSSLNKYFPYIIDTKIILNSNLSLQQRMKKSSTSLSSAFSLLCPHIALGAYRNSDLASHVKVEVQVDDVRSSNWNSGVKHEAGYDAFMTGCLFAQVCTHLGIDFKVQPPSGRLAHFENLQKHINLLYLSWINGDIINLSTGNRVVDAFGSYYVKKQYRKIVFENIVLLWNFASKLKSSEIRQCLAKVFGLTSVASIYRLDETAVFVEFSKPDLVSDFLFLKDYLERSNDAISVLHPLSKLLEGGNTCAARYETYKQICSLPISKVLFADQAAATGIRWKTELVGSKLEGKSKRSKKLILDNQLDEQSTCNDEVKQARAITL